MSKLSFFQRSALNVKSLNDDLTNASNVLIEKHATLREQARDATFKSSAVKSSSSFKQKLFEHQKQYNVEAQNFIVEMVRQACPIDLSGVGLEELTQQVAFVKDTYSEIINEATPFAVVTGVPAGIDTGSPSQVALILGGANKETGINLARKVLSVKAAYGCRQTADAGISVGLNVIDTAITNIDPTATDKASVDAMYEQVFSKLAGMFSKEVRQRVATNLKEDADRMLISDSELLEGLSELASKKMQRDLRKRQPSLLNEVFLTTKVLNESSTATDEDYLNEAVFVSTVLESLNVLGMIDKNLPDIQLALSKKRRAFAK